MNSLFLMNFQHLPKNVNFLLYRQIRKTDIFALDWVTHYVLTLYKAQELGLSWVPKSEPELFDGCQNGRALASQLADSSHNCSSSRNPGQASFGGSVHVGIRE